MTENNLSFQLIFRHKMGNKNVGSHLLLNLDLLWNH